MIPTERKRELRRLAKSKAFETGFAADTRFEVACLQLFPHFTTAQESRYALRFLVRYHADWARRYAAARARLQARGAQ
jgi:hypothetical protein